MLLDCVGMIWVGNREPALEKGAAQGVDSERFGPERRIRAFRREANPQASSQIPPSIDAKLRGAVWSHVAGQGTAAALSRRRLRLVPRQTNVVTPSAAAQAPWLNVVTPRQRTRETKLNVVTANVLEKACCEHPPDDGSDEICQRSRSRGAPRRSKGGHRPRSWECRCCDGADPG